MNIEKRIEKLEKDANIYSVFCTCPGEAQICVILPDLDLSEADRLREQEERMQPEYCDRCKKLIEHQSIIVEVVKPAFR